MSGRQHPLDIFHKVQDLATRLYKLERSFHAHGITSSTHTSFPGGTSQFLRADAVFAVPPGGGGGGGDPTFQIFSGAGKTSVADSDFGSTPANGVGAIAWDTTTGIKRLGIRVSAVWYHVELS